MTQRILIAATLVAIAAPDARTQEAPLDAATKQRVVAKIAEQLRRGYIYEERGAELGRGLEAALAAGGFDAAAGGEAFAKAMTKHLYGASDDGHLRIYYARKTPEDQPRRRSHGGARDSSFGFRSLQILAGNVGYLDLRGFADEAARARAEAAMAYFADVDALIIDLGRNHGGGPFMVRFISAHLFAEPTHLASTFMRGWDAPAERWTLEGVDGTLADVPVFVLTSGETFSAAESFTFGLKINERITTVGGRTGGGGHFGQTVDLGDEFGMFLPRGRTYDPKTGKGWEAEGIRADVEVPYEEALVTAHDLAREAIAEH